jgi:hypothetical protein
MHNCLKWIFVERWLVKFAVRDWMTADANKFKERKQYYFARMVEDFCGMKRNHLVRRDLQAILQLRGKVNG